MRTLRHPSHQLLNERGMTLIEIMIVMAILAGLIGVLGTTAMNQYRKSQIEQTRLSMREIAKQLEAYNLSCNSYPTTEQGLAALVEPPGDGCPNWGPDPYIKKSQLKDRWGNDFYYESDGARFVIMSYGADRKPGGTGVNKDLSSEEE